jgi:hypothetical protein
VGKEYLEGGRSLPDDLRQTLSGLSSADLANLGLSGVLAKMLAGKDPAKVQELLAQAKQLGLA